MRVELWFLLLLAAAPATYAWWSGRAIRRSIDDPTLPELLLARQRRLVQVTLVAIIASAFVTAPTGFSLVVVLGVLAAQYPIRRTVYGDTWSFPQYVRFTTMSWIAFGGLWLFPIVAAGIVAQLASEWIPTPSTRQTMLGLVLGVVASIVYLVWHRRFSRVWLALNQASPLDANGVHAELLPRFHAVLDRSGDRLPVHPTIHRYGAAGGQVVNAAALCSLHGRAVAMSDTLLASLDADEATAIFAHEIAHHEHHTDARLRKRRFAALVLALLLAVVPAIQLASRGHYALAINVLFLFAILLFFARGQAGHRAHETECDLRAVDLTGDADAVIRALTKIHALSRMPRRFSQEFERAATHPSLARRIQAIRAHASVTESVPDDGGPTVVATTTAGTYVALDDARSYWFEGVPDDTPLDVGALRERATSYRALAYRELGELRLVAERPRMLRAVDLAGRAWSVGVRDDDVARVQAALDRVDAQLGSAPVEPRARSMSTARAVAATLLIATMIAGFWGAATFVTVIAMIAPGAAALAAMAATTIGGVVLALGARQLGEVHETIALVVAALTALWAAWIAWKRVRGARDGALREEPSRQAVLWSRALYAVLVLGVLVSLLGLAFGGASSPAALLGDPDLARSAIAVLGLGAALLVVRARAWRLAGTGLVALAVAAMLVGTIGERWSASSSAIAWSEGRLSPVASVPIGRDVHEVALSPAGTRFLTRRYVGDEDDEDGGYTSQIVTGSIPQRGATRTFPAIDALLPNEREVLVLAGMDGDSLELRLERHDADSASRLVWRRALSALADAHLRLDANGTRWIVRGRRSEGRRHRLATISGAMDGTDVRSVEVPADSLRGQAVYSYRDGATLVLATSPRRAEDFAARSIIATYFAALRGDAIDWTIWRYERGGSREVMHLRGYPTCAAMADDAAVCVEQRGRAARMFSLARDGGLVDLGALSYRYDRASASPSGQVVASSFRGRRVAIVDVAHRRGVRTSLPAGDYSYLREISATDEVVGAVLGTSQGLRLAVYRLAPEVAGASVAVRR
jgi:Zn-dependent protease with chaperone function